MFLHLIPEQNKEDFCYVAALLSIADKPLLWGGRRKEDVTLNTKKEDLSIQHGEKESALMKLWFSYREIHIIPREAERDLIAQLRNCPEARIESPEMRASAACNVLRSRLQGKNNKLPSVSKCMLIQFMLLALADGNISAIEYQLLADFKTHYGLEDFIFEELLERAESIYRETNKTVALLLE